MKFNIRQAAAKDSINKLWFQKSLRVRALGIGLGRQEEGLDLSKVLKTFELDQLQIYSLGCVVHIKIKVNDFKLKNQVQK